MQLDGSGSLLLVSGETVYLESGIKHLLAYVLVWISGFVGEQITFFLRLPGKFLILLLSHLLERKWVKRKIHCHCFPKQTSHSVYGFEFWDKEKLLVSGDWVGKGIILVFFFCGVLCWLHITNVLFTRQGCGCRGTVVRYELRALASIAWPDWDNFDPNNVMRTCRKKKKKKTGRFILRFQSNCFPCLSLSLFSFSKIVLLVDLLIYLFSQWLALDLFSGSFNLNGKYVTILIVGKQSRFYLLNAYLTELDYFQNTPPCMTIPSGAFSFGG